jgi:O-antigen ligase
VGAELEAAEASHFWDAMLVLPYMVHLAVQGSWTTLLWFTLAQMLINIYPIMHLRVTRHRLGRLASRKSLHPVFSEFPSRGAGSPP